MKRQTSSWSVWIMGNKNKLFVRRYKKIKNKFYVYPRTIPLEKTMLFLQNTNLYLPKLYKNSSKYIDEEFIEATTSIYDYPKLNLIDKIVECENILYSLSTFEFGKFIFWNNNEEYYSYLVNYILNNIDKFDIKTVTILMSLQIDEELLKKIKDKKMDNNRKMSFIHGDIKLDNLIMSDDKLYLIDWELATVGDIAYEFATCFLLMNYSKEEQEYFLDLFLKYNNIDRDTLKRDINSYMIFELIRRCYSRMDKLVKKVNDKDYFELFYDEYYLLNNYLNRRYYSKDEVKEIMTKYL